MKPSITPREDHKSNSRNLTKMGTVLGLTAALAMTACKPDFKGNDKDPTVASLAKGTSKNRQLLENAARASELPRVGGAPAAVQSFDNLHEFLSGTVDDGTTIRDTHPNGEYVDFAFTIKDDSITVTFTSPGVTNTATPPVKKPLDGTVIFKKTGEEITFTDMAGIEKPVSVAELRTALKTHLGVK